MLYRRLPLHARARVPQRRRLSLSLSLSLLAATPAESARPRAWLHVRNLHPPYTLSHSGHPLINTISGREIETCLSRAARLRISSRKSRECVGRLQSCRVGNARVVCSTVPRRRPALGCSSGSNGGTTASRTTEEVVSLATCTRAAAALRERALDAAKVPILY